MNIRPLLYCTVLLSLCVGTMADTGYRKLLPDGSVEFSDQPSPDASPVDLPPVQSYQGYRPPPRKVAPVEVAAEPEMSEERPVYTGLAIRQPSNDDNILANDHRLPVVILPEPELFSGDKIAIELDGKEVQRDALTRFILVDVYRGSHTLRAHLYSEDGTLLISTDPITVHIRQQSILH